MTAENGEMENEIPVTLQINQKIGAWVGSAADSALTPIALRRMPAPIDPAARLMTRGKLPDRVTGAGWVTGASLAVRAVLRPCDPSMPCVVH